MAARFSGTLQLDANSVTNESISSAQSATIDADKLQHVYKAGTNFALAIGGTPAAREEIVFVATQAGTIRGFHALLNDTGTTTDVDFDLKKNGVSILSAVVTITHATADKAVQDGTLSATTLAADDILSIQLIVTSATAAQGPFAWVELEENYAP